MRHRSIISVMRMKIPFPCNVFCVGMFSRHNGSLRRRNENDVVSVSDYVCSV